MAPKPHSTCPRYLIWLTIIASLCLQAPVYFRDFVCKKCCLLLVIVRESSDARWSTRAVVVKKSSQYSRVFNLLRIKFCNLLENTKVCFRFNFHAGVVGSVICWENLSHSLSIIITASHNLNYCKFMNYGSRVPTVPCCKSCAGKNRARSQMVIRYNFCYLLRQHFWYKIQIVLATCETN